MKLPAAALIVIVLSACSAGQIAEQTHAAEESRPRIDITPRGVAQSPHPITLEEIVSLREVSEPARSPDGSKVAFLVTQAFREIWAYDLVTDGEQCRTV